MGEVRGALALPTAAGGAARLAVARLVAKGIDPEPILRAAGITRLQIADDDTRVSSVGQTKLLRLVAEALQDDLLGFHMARSCELREAGLVYFVMTSSATFGEALARAERYCSINNESIAMRCLSGSEFHIRHSYVGVPRQST